MTASLTTDPKATILTGVTLAITEPTGVTAGNWNKNTKSVSVTSGSSIILLKDTQYSKVTMGKIIINKDVFENAQVYTVTAAPSSITGTFTVTAGGGTVSGSVQFLGIGSAASGNSLVYVVSSQSTIQVKLGNPLNGYTSLAATTDE